MKFHKFLFLLILLSNIAHAQIVIIPDTVCVGETVEFDFSHPNKFTTYTWDIGNSDISSIATNTFAVGNTGTVGNSLFSVAAQATMVFDVITNTFRAFVTSASVNAANPSLQRLDFGNNPNSIPVVANLGNPSNVLVGQQYGNLEAIEFTVDNFGIYHAFLTNRGIVHLVFGNGLNAPPTQTRRIFDNPAHMMMGMQLVLKNYNGSWYLFAGNTYGMDNIMRFDLGSNLNTILNTVPKINLPNPPSNYLGSPAYFSILKNGTNWHLVYTSLTTNSASYRYDFGTDLLNTNPSVSHLGGFNVPYVRGLNYITSCDSFYQIGLTQSGTLFSLNYQNNINNIPQLNNLGNLFGVNKGIQMLKPYWYNDTLWALSSSFVSNNINTVFRTPLLNGNAGNTISKYYNARASHIFTSPGEYNITLYCDQADPGGPETYCKKIVVLSDITSNSRIDTAFCLGDTLALSANNSNQYNSFLWSNGSTNAIVDIFVAGTYWVKSTNNCRTQIDTFVVVDASQVVMDINTLDTAICSGESIQIIATGSDIYKWEPNVYLNNNTIANPIAKPPVTTTYFVSTGLSSHCEQIDSITIIVNDLPIIKAVSDGEYINCLGDGVQLNATGGIRYEWYPAAYFSNPSISNPLVKPDGYSHFYVIGYDENGCQATDSIMINSNLIPAYFIPNAFSPNGDGLNDLFLPIVQCDPDFEFQSIVVYNRYGNLVFISYDNFKGWDGTFNGKACDIGVYYWYISAKNRNNEILSRKGSLTLLR